VERWNFCLSLSLSLLGIYRKDPIPCLEYTCSCNKLERDY
jgi:hypothetical protein